MGNMILDRKIAYSPIPFLKTIFAEMTHLLAAENRFILFGKWVCSGTFLIPKTASHFSENGFVVAHF